MKKTFPIVLMINSVGLLAQDDLSLDTILSLDTNNISTLLGGKLEQSPATINKITAKDIERSTGRTLSDVLNRLQPGFQSSEQVWVTPVWGFRGIINDRSENVLLNVNGEMQNLLSKVGVQGEAVLGLMNDIQEVQVISGPASVVHGPGALTGVINVDLKDGLGKNDKSEEINVAVGNQKNDVSFQYAKVVKFGENKAFRLDGGYMEHSETQNGYAGFSGTGMWSGELNRHTKNKQFGGNYRLTGVYTDKDAKFRAWFRYYRAEYDNGILNNAQVALDGDPALGRTHFHENLSISADKTTSLSGNFELKHVVGLTMASSGIMQSQTNYYGRAQGYQGEGTITDGIAETRARYRADLKFKNDIHPFVVGTEFRTDIYRSNPLGPSTANGVEWSATNNRQGKIIPDVVYTNIALFTEYQYKGLGDSLKPMLGARYDKHTKFSTLSPRVALVSSLWKDGNFRAVYQSAYKALSVDNIRGGNEDITQAPNSNQLPSSNKSLEFGYNHTLENFNFDLVYYSNKQLLYTWDNSVYKQVATGVNTQGAELKASYQGEAWKLAGSHSYTGIDGKLWATSSYASDKKNIYNFMSNVTRLTLENNYTETFSGQLTLRYYWAQPAYKNLVHDNPTVAGINYFDKNFLKFDYQFSWLPNTSNKFLLNLENFAGLLSKQYEGNFTYSSNTGGADAQKLLVYQDVPRVRISWVRTF